MGRDSVMASTTRWLLALALIATVLTCAMASDEVDSPESSGLPGSLKEADGEAGDLGESAGLEKKGVKGKTKTSKVGLKTVLKMTPKTKAPCPPKKGTSAKTKKLLKKMGLPTKSPKKVKMPKAPDADRVKHHAAHLERARLNLKKHEKKAAKIAKLKKTLKPSEKKLIKAYATEVNPQKGPKIKKKIEDLRKKRVHLQLDKDQEDLEIKAMKRKEKYHADSLKHMGIKVPADENESKHQAKERLKKKEKKKLDKIKAEKRKIRNAKDKLVDHVRDNKEVLGKINKHYNLRAKKAKAKLKAKKLKAAKKQLAKAVAAAAKAKTEKGAAAAAAEMKRAQGKIGKDKAKLKKAKKAVAKKEAGKDPIKLLTAFGRKAVEAIRKKIKDLAKTMADHAKKHRKALAPLTKSIKDKKKVMAKVKNPKKLLIFHKDIKKMNLKIVALKKAQKQKDVKNHKLMAKLKKDEQHMLTKAPRKKKPVKHDPKAKRAMKKAKKDAARLPKVAKEVNKALNAEEKKRVALAKDQEKKGTEKDEIAKLEAQHAATPRRRKATEIKKRIEKLKISKEKEKKKIVKAKAKKKVADELKSKRQQVMLD